MSTSTLQYDLSTRTWTSPSGVAGTDWLPPLVFGASPTWDVQCTGPLPPGYADAQTWSLAVARDWLSATTPMCRTSEGVAVTQTAGGLAITAPIDTATERFLRVVDGLGDGLRCWMQVVGADASGAPCCHITLPLLCLPALDPHGTAGPLPPIPTTPLTEDEVENIAEQAAQEALGDYYSKPETDDLLDGKIGTAEKGASNGVAELDENGKVPSGQLPVAEQRGQYGAIKLADTIFGLALHASGSIYVVRATNNQIDARLSVNDPLMPSNLNYAVTAALTDAKHIELSDSQAATARAVLGMSSAITTIPAATSAYSLLDATGTTNGHSWQYVHEPAAAPTYTLPAVTDAAVAHQIDLKVKFSSSVLTYSFLDSAGNAVTPLAQPEIAAGTVVDFLCEYDPLSSQWAVMPLLLAEGGAS